MSAKTLSPLLTLSPLENWPYAHAISSKTLRIPQYAVSLRCTRLFHWGRDNMAAIFQTTFTFNISCMKIVLFSFECHWNVFAMIELTWQHGFRLWLGANHLKLRWPCLLAHTCLTRLGWVKCNELLVRSHPWQTSLILKRGPARKLFSLCGSLTSVPAVMTEYQSIVLVYK